MKPVFLGCKKAQPTWEPSMKSEAYTGFAPGRMIIDPADVGPGLGGILSFALDSSTGMLTPGVSGLLHL